MYFRECKKENSNLSLSCKRELLYSKCALLQSVNSGMAYKS